MATSAPSELRRRRGTRQRRTTGALVTKMSLQIQEVRYQVLRNADVEAALPHGNEGHADRMRQSAAALGEPGHELVCSAAGITADQRLLSSPAGLGHPGRRELSVGDVVGGGVGAALPSRSRPATGSPLPSDP